MAARGGLCGGEWVPEGTSGIPQGPAGAGRGVMETAKARSGVVDDVTTRFNVGFGCVHVVVAVTVVGLSVTTTTILSGEIRVSRHSVAEPGLLLSTSGGLWIQGFDFTG